MTRKSDKSKKSAKKKATRRPAMCGLALTEKGKAALQSGTIGYTADAVNPVVVEQEQPAEQTAA